MLIPNEANLLTIVSYSPFPLHLQHDITNYQPTLFVDSRGAFYVLFVGALSGGLAFIIGFLAHRFAFLVSAGFAFLAFLCEAVGCIIWTVIIHRVRNNINGAGVGITVEYGVGLWLYWASTGCLLLATLPCGLDLPFYSVLQGKVVADLLLALALLPYSHHWMHCWT